MSPPTPPRAPGKGKAATRHLNVLALRLAMLALLFGTLTLAWWRTNCLLPLQRQARATHANLSRLNQEIEQMEAKWSPEEVETLQSQYQQLPDRLFTGQDSLAIWLRELRETLVPLALEANADFSKIPTDPWPDKKVTTIPATVSFEVKPAEGIESYGSPYQRVLRLIQYLGNQPKRADLVELQVFGHTNSVNRAVAILNLWAGDPTL